MNEFNKLRMDFSELMKECGSTYKLSFKWLPHIYIAIK